MQIIKKVSDDVQSDNITYNLIKQNLSVKIKKKLTKSLFFNRSAEFCAITTPKHDKLTSSPQLRIYWFYEYFAAFAVTITEPIPVDTVVRI